ncbi:MAG: InlB B-repeat-containing protein, partial [Bacteroidota bacterium]
QVITANASPSRAGYTFAGWKDQSGNTISQAANGWTITATSYLAFATWTPIPYQVTYDSAGGSLAPSESAKNIGDFITVKTAVTRTGYTFNGWVAGGVTYGPGASIQIGTADVTFTASWTAINYVASYDLNGGTSAVPSSVTTIYLSNVTVATAPTRPGYTFNNWSDGTSSVTPDSSYGMPARNITFTAQWTAIDYSVSYNSNGGSTAPSGLSGRHIGDTFLVGAAVTLSERLFLGWSDGTNTYSAGQTYVVQTSNVVFTAVWSGQLYSITYNANGGSGTPPTEDSRLTNDSFFVAPGTSLGRTGYTFAGWTSGGQSYQPNDVFTVGSSALTFTAIWNKNSITLTFDANGGSPASTTQGITADTATNLSTNSFTRSDYTFGGWTANSDGTGSQFTNGQSVNFLESKTLYAKWIPAFVV